jgi:hypothetical protein
VRCGGGLPARTGLPKTKKRGICPAGAGPRALAATWIPAAGVVESDRWARRQVGIIATASIATTEDTTRRTARLFTILLWPALMTVAARDTNDST